MKASQLFYGLIVLVSLSSCIFGKKKDNPNPCPEFNEDELIFEVQDEFTTLPGKVSVFFKLDDKSDYPIAGLNATDFQIYEKGRNDDCLKLISVSESKARISPNTQIFRYNTMLVLDLSGSVISTSLSELIAASKSFAMNVMPAQPDDSYKLGVWWFDGTDSLYQLIDFTSNRNDVITAVEGINASLSTDPSTDLYGAVIKSTALATGVLQGFISSGIISAQSVVIFTDGTDQASRYAKQDALNAVSTANDQISFFTIGLGSEIDAIILGSIGKTASVLATNKTELESKFLAVSQLVYNEANSYYLFEYCSPKRNESGENKLTIVASKGSNKGSVETLFDATGFTSGCQ